MSVSDVISVIGTGITLIGFAMDLAPKAPENTTISYMIANDGANGGALTNSGGHSPDVRLWDETGEYLGGKMDPGKCQEGKTDRTTQVDTQEAATRTPSASPGLVYPGPAARAAVKASFSIMSSGGQQLPDLGHITDTIIWGQE